MAAYGFGGAQRRIPEGQFTQTIYTLIKEHKLNEAIAHLTVELQVVDEYGVNSLVNSNDLPLTFHGKPSSTELPGEPCSPVAAGLLLLLHRAV
jgi:hypothetical protein